ncbi:Pantothenate synthetase [Paraconexibacter sp. AEG42_29]|uniref:Pantothenate synthetase n=1 Tax=Paraconexibacter sp. AEG42_29 TaxID=2997339 RepID=A0AAU7AXD9_9ACTN
MRTLRTVSELRTAVRAARRQDPQAQIGLVPTMGALHDGHLELMRQARLECEHVVVSLFVNPSQFNAEADLAAYPRDELTDAGLVTDAGADFLFAPALETVYPPGFATSVQLSGPLVDSLEGAHRGAAHFHGVTTVVTKLLNMVQPDVAFFGAKDAQQVLVIRKLVADLDLPVRIEAVSTVREPDGLARSSRNVRLTPDDRPQAIALHAALTAAEQAYAAGERDAAVVRAAAATEMTRRGIAPEYLALVDPTTLSPVTTVADGTLVAVAAHVGGVRLIDNTTLQSPSPNGRR